MIRCLRDKLVSSFQYNHLPHPDGTVRILLGRPSLFIISCCSPPSLSQSHPGLDSLTILRLTLQQTNGKPYPWERALRIRLCLKLPFTEQLPSIIWGHCRKTSICSNTFGHEVKLTVIAWTYSVGFLAPSAVKVALLTSVASKSLLN